ncbi:MAG TPA: nuclear transport factor 2 family protein [Terriglobia bacterium]|nr:nuclear transport factor 2 family protein [Terriglobia bacterium]
MRARAETMKCVTLAPGGKSPTILLDDAALHQAIPSALDPVFAVLNKHAAKMHFLGQSTILNLTAGRGTGETCGLPNHLSVEGGKRQLMIAALRCHDTFVKMDGAWLFVERLLYAEWLDERALS